MYTLCWTEQQSQTELVSPEMNRYNVDIAALSPTRLPGYDGLKDHGYIFFWSGKSTQERGEAGVSFAVRKEIAAMLDEEPVPINDRIMTTRLQLHYTHQCICPNTDQHRAGEGRVQQ